MPAQVLDAHVMAAIASCSSGHSQHAMHAGHAGHAPGSASSSSGHTPEAAVWQCLREPQGVTSHRNMPSGLARTSWHISQFYLDKLVYQGRASSLHLARDKQSGMALAVKRYHKAKLSMLNMRQVEREVAIHLELKHPSIIKLYACFEDGETVCLVLEPAACDVFHRMKGLDRLDEESCRALIRPCLQACSYLHAKGILHRDIKPENLLCTSTSEPSELKLADFGLAVDSRFERPVTRLGTLDFMAPEVLRCPDKRLPEEFKDRADLIYGPAVDVWAIGVLALELLTGEPPFGHKTRIETYEHILHGEVHIPAHLSADAAAFIAAALNRNAKSRPSVDQLLQHPWVTAPALNSSVTTAPSPHPSCLPPVGHSPAPHLKPLSPTPLEQSLSAPTPQPASHSPDLQPKAGSKPGSATLAALRPEQGLFWEAEPSWAVSGQELNSPCASPSGEFGSKHVSAPPVVATATLAKLVTMAGQTGGGEVQPAVWAGGDDGDLWGASKPGDADATCLLLLDNACSQVKLGPECHASCASCPGLRPSSTSAHAEETMAGGASGPAALAPTCKPWCMALFLSCPGNTQAASSEEAGACTLEQLMTAGLSCPGAETASETLQSRVSSAGNICTLANTCEHAEKMACSPQVGAKSAGYGVSVWTDAVTACQGEQAPLAALQLLAATVAHATQANLAPEAVPSTPQAAAPMVPQAQAPRAVVHSPYAVLQAPTTLVPPAVPLVPLPPSGLPLPKLRVRTGMLTRLQIPATPIASNPVSGHSEALSPGSPMIASPLSVWGGCSDCSSGRASPTVVHSTAHSTVHSAVHRAVHSVDHTLTGEDLAWFTPAATAPTGSAQARPFTMATTPARNSQGRLRQASPTCHLEAASSPPSGAASEVAWQPSGSSLEAARKLHGSCQEAVWQPPRGSLEAVRKLHGSCGGGGGMALQCSLQQTRGQALSPRGSPRAADCGGYDRSLEQKQNQVQGQGQGLSPRGSPRAVEWVRTKKSPEEGQGQGQGAGSRSLSFLPAVSPCSLALRPSVAQQQQQRMFPCQRSSGAGPEGVPAAQPSFVTSGHRPTTQVPSTRGHNSDHSSQPNSASALDALPMSMPYSRHGWGEDSYTHSAQTQGQVPGMLHAASSAAAAAIHAHVSLKSRLELLQHHSRSLGSGKMLQLQQQQPAVTCGYTGWQSAVNADRLGFGQLGSGCSSSSSSLEMPCQLSGASSSAHLPGADQAHLHLTGVAMSDSSPAGSARRLTFALPHNETPPTQPGRLHRVQSRLQRT